MTRRRVWWWLRRFARLQVTPLTVHDLVVAAAIAALILVPR